MHKTILGLLFILCFLSGCALPAETPLYRCTELEEPPLSAPGTSMPGTTAKTDRPSAELQNPSLDPYAGVEITFLATGDNLIHPNIYMDARKRGTAEKEYDFLPMYTDVADRIAEVDFAFINQETVMAGESYGYSGYPTFNSPRQLGLDLVTLGFDIIGLANNHMLDMGSDGLADTVQFWDTQPVVTIGASAVPDPVILEQDGVTIGLLAYTYSTNGFRARADAEIIIPYIDEEQIRRDIAVLREKQTDITIVSIHWGVENSHVPTEEQTQLARMMADEGVDVIIGHHSHCIQPIEWITGTDGNETLCIYSLGNCVSGMAAPLNQVGGLFTFSIVSDGQGGVQVKDPLFTPTVFYYGPNWFNTHLYLLEDYTEDIAVSHGVQINGYTLSADAARKIVTDVIDPQFLPEYLRKE